MDRQIAARLVLAASVLTMAILALISDVSRIAVAAIVVPVAFAFSAATILGLPYWATMRAEEHAVGWLKLLDVLEHATILSWVGLGALWSTGFVAFMGLTGASLGYVLAFAVTAIIGLASALQNLYYSEEPDDMQAPWQRHPS